MAKRATRSVAKGAPSARGKSRTFILALETFEGEDTACYLFGADPMWIVLDADPVEGATIVDAGYRTLKEARKAWPEAVAPSRGRRCTTRQAPTGWNRIPPVFSEPWFQNAWRKAKEVRARTHRAPW